MQKLIELKQRMKTVENIQTITRTLATVSSAKLSRNRQKAAGMRQYTEKMRQTLHHQQEYLERQNLKIEELSQFMIPRPKVENIVLVHLAGDRGMCGNYNIAANRKSFEFIEAQEEQGKNVQLIIKGEKGERYFRKKTNNNILHSEGWKRAGVLPEDVDRLYQKITSLFLSGEADEVYCLYTQFYSPIRRFPRIVRMLPVQAGNDVSARAVNSEAGKEDDKPEKWVYEPSFQSILDELIAIFLRIQVEDVLLESYASEQGARMITMEEATERADKTLQECSMLYNRLRREVITIDLLGVLFASRAREEEERKAQAS